MAPDTPPIAELLNRFLAQQAEARAAGITEAPVSEVEPFEAVAFATVDPRTAWGEAVLALTLLDTERAALKMTPPADWAGLVSAPAAAEALPMAAGHFPQLVRDLTALMQPERRAELRPKPQPALAVSRLEDWAARAVRERRFPEVLLAVGTLRLARHLDKADELLAELRPHVPERWRMAFANEEAALAWQKGDAEAARAIWAALPESAPVCFNRGMAALFTDRPAEARAELTRATALLPDDDPWQHLARLYLALAQM